MAAGIAFGTLVLVALWERLRPRRRLEFPALRRRLGNISIWLFNVIVAALVFTSPAVEPVHLWPSGVPGTVAAFLFLDLLSYAIHRAQHAVPLLWRLHALHHSDPDVDVTTALRQHPLEYLPGTACVWGAILALGIPLTVAALHGTTAFVLAVATHGNVRWPGWLERALRPVLITPGLHLVHHSVNGVEANANFGQVFCVWDRLFGTLLHRLADELNFGVAELSRRDACRPREMLLTPWRLSMPNITHRLPDGREIEASWQIAGGRLRLRARLVDTNGVVVESLRRDYDAADVNARADFQTKFEALTGIALGGPLFPQANDAARLVA